MGRSISWLSVTCHLELHPLVILLYTVLGITETESGRTFLISATKLCNLFPVHIRSSASIRLCWRKWFSYFITFIYLFNIYFYFLFFILIYLYLFYFLSYFLIYFHLISFGIQNSIMINYAGVWGILLCKHIWKLVSIVI